MSSDTPYIPLYGPPEVTSDAHRKEGRNRAIFREWPRDPNGPVLRQEESGKGKQTSNGIEIWGATLYDFYLVKRIPNVPNLRTISSGSKLAAWAQKCGELNWAKDELAWAKEEEDPVEVYPCDIEKIICSFERNIRAFMGLKSQSISYPIFPFAYPSYPKPWPLIPFSRRMFTLQKRIPFHLLPKKLIVHDPRHLLLVGDPDERTEVKVKVKDEEWKGATHTYSLRTHRPAEKDDEPESFILWPTVGENGPNTPPVKIIPQTPPPVLPRSSVAHLYLSPSHTIGKGGHSVVYKAEWELSRSLVVPPRICKECLSSSILHELENSTPEYETVTVTDESAIYDPPVAPELEGQASDHEYKIGGGVFTFTTEHRPEVNMEGVFSSDDSRKTGRYKVKPACTWIRETYEGPIRCVRPMVKRHSPDEGPLCSHLMASGDFECVPPTVKVYVAAKLSVPDDDHLENEADNYEAFPSHLFEHWSGFNVVPPLHDPVPVGAVVPQYYGYYVPQDVPESYLSPILLMECCGKQVDPRSLGKDDRQECASLVYRLHQAGWKHGSVFDRNVVMQLGPLSELPYTRVLNNVLSFRLIDFGRSEPFDHDVDGNLRALEEKYVRDLLDLL